MTKIFSIHKIQRLLLGVDCQGLCNYSMGLCCSKSSELIEDDQCPTATLASGNVTLITQMEKWEEKLAEANRDGKIVVVNFSASWCSPCRTVAPAFCELAEKYTSIMFLTVDVDELAEFSTSWDIKATPTFFYLKEGREVDKLVGANQQELYKKTAAVASSMNKSRSSNSRC